MVSSLNVYFNKEKARMFPEVKDWSDPRDDIRNVKDVNTLTHKDWFWFHPSAYALISVGMYVIPSIGFGLMCMRYNWSILGLFSAILFGFVAYKLLMTCLRYEEWKGKTFHDIYLREF